MSDDKSYPKRLGGWLDKLTSYSRGYQRRWFVLSSGTLSYYRTQEEMAHTCRGTVNLAGAFIDTIDSCHFVITNGPSQVFHLRATNEMERQRWVTALEFAKANAVRMLESVDDSDSEEQDQPLVKLRDKLQSLTETHDTLYGLVIQHGQQLVAVKDNDHSSPEAVNKVAEKVAMFKLATGALIKNVAELDLVARTMDRWCLRQQQQQYCHGNNVSPRLKARHDNTTPPPQKLTNHNGIPSDDNISNPQAIANSTSKDSTDNKTIDPQLAQQESDTDSDESPLVAAVVESLDEAQVSSSSDDDHEFFDAVEQSRTESSPIEATISPVNSVTIATTSLDRTEPPSVNVSQSPLVTKEDKVTISPSSDHVNEPLESGYVATDNFLSPCQPTITNRRTTIPPRPNIRLNLWSLMKNSIGKDLSKIPLPVNFNEPLSFLQRINEDLIYHSVLEQAVKAKDPWEQICYVAAFASSSYASTVYRTGKPFNPLLGETYECDRRSEMGWRSFCEQVSHHPPACAQHVEHKDWTFWQDYTMGSKFRGKYLLIIPYGTAHLVFHKTGNHYTWSKVLTYIHNIIIGKLWIDQSGDLEVTNHKTGDKCVVRFIPYSYFSRERMRRVTGNVTDKTGKQRYVLNGYWDEFIECSEVLGGSEKDLNTGPAKVVWRAVPSKQQEQAHMYGFSEFTCSLNEPEEGVCPTDSRLRPDQRIMENEDFDTANIEKVRLEENQRAKRRKREAAAAKAAEAAAQGKHEEAKQLEEESSYSPFWFHKQFDPCTNTMAYKYKGGYWEAKSKGHFPDVPDLF
ncbi:oxysterol-binding protein 1-like [Dysidea avara]|uniref:oxysterol-binding protein 1-like n=1 Tax=Dysidea avara TaxID=196820 RepID=UPI00332BF0A8